MISLVHLITHAFRRGPRKPLTARQPERADAGMVPLGMEATDVALVDRVTRQNDALERINGTRAYHINARFATTARTDVTHVDVIQIPEDETYATRFFRVFQRKGN